MNKKDLDKITDRIVTINGEKVRILKPTKNQPWGKYKKKPKAKDYFSKIQNSK